MDFDREWTVFAAEAENEHCGMARLVAAHNKLRGDITTAYERGLADGAEAENVACELQVRGRVADPCRIITGFGPMAQDELTRDSLANGIAHRRDDDSAETEGQTP